MDGGREGLAVERWEGEAYVSTSGEARAWDVSHERG